MAYRAEKLNELLKREISKIIFEDTQFGTNVFATVFQVAATEDLKQAIVTISVFPTEKSDHVIEVLTKASGHYQHELSERLDLRHIPRLKFVLTKDEEKGQKVEELLRKLKEEEDL